MNGLAVFPVRRDLQDGRTTQSAMGNQHFFVLEKRSEEHTSELQSRLHLVCRLLLEKKKKGADNQERAAELRATGRSWTALYIGANEHSSCDAAVTTMEPRCPRGALDRDIRDCRLITAPSVLPPRSELARSAGSFPHVASSLVHFLPHNSRPVIIDRTYISNLHRCTTPPYRPFFFF